jgi:undecaprenyl-diphosphatase
MFIHIEKSKLTLPTQHTCEIMLQTLKQLDVALLKYINSTLSNPLFDAIMPWLRESWFWLPLYLFFLVFAIVNFRARSAWWIAGFIVSVSSSDIISSRVFKEVFQRIRPCRDPEVLPQIVLRLQNCSGGYSFTSSHASNHFAMAAYVFFSLAAVAPVKYRSAMFVWAAAVSYAQVYVGVHYPADVLAGALLGSLIGTIIAKYLGRHHAFSLQTA